MQAHQSDSYAPPVDQLLTLGEAEMGVWPDYLGLGLHEEHCRELIRMATDESLAHAGRGSTELWAGVHAWRTLGQLRAESAIESLGNRLAESDIDDDWELQELPIVLAMMGPVAISKLIEVLEDSLADPWARASAVEGLVKVAVDHPQTREEIIEALMRRLRNVDSEVEEVITSVVSGLADLKATEAAPLMEQAFEADKVDTWLRGDWEDVQIDMGLLDQRKTPRPIYEVSPLRGNSPSMPPLQPLDHRAKNKAKELAKAKRKSAKESRKRNRKRK